MPQLLPSDPSLDHLRGQAKELRRACHSGRPEALDRVCSSHPVYLNAEQSDQQLRSLSLRDAQLVIAREYFFDDWSRMKEYIEWDLPVRRQEISTIAERLRERPSRATQSVMQFRRNGTTWSKAPIHLANNSIPMLELLLKHGAELDPAGHSVLGPDSSPEFIDYALSKGVDLENEYYNGNVLGLAVYFGYADTVRHYLLRGVNMTSRNQDDGAGMALLHNAAFCYYQEERWESYTEIVRHLIEAGADVNARTNVDEPSEAGRHLIVQGEIPLHFAAAYGQAEMIEVLLQAGANKKAKTAQGETPLDYAIRERRPKSILELLK